MSSHSYCTRFKGKSRTQKQSRSTRNRIKINYNESSPEPTPSLLHKYGGKGSIKEICIPSLHDDGKYWVEAKYWNDEVSEYSEIPVALNKFGGDEDKHIPSYKTFLKSLFGSKHISSHLQNAIESGIYVKVEPEIPVGSILYLMDDSLPILLRYILIIDYNHNMTAEFDEIDDHPIYSVVHIDLRQNKFTKFNKTSGKPFNLTRPTGLVTKDAVLNISSSKYIGNTYVSWLEARCHYYQLLAETAENTSQIVTSLFTRSISVLIDGAAARVRGTLFRRNEGKIKTFAFSCAPAAMDSVLNTKFRDIKKLKESQIFFKKGTSTYYIFTSSQSGVIIGDENINRDYAENGRELFPDDDNSEDQNMENIDFDASKIAYTISISALLIRFCRRAKKITFTWNPVRVDANGSMTGQSTAFWTKYAKKFDYKDFKIKPNKHK